MSNLPLIKNPLHIRITHVPNVLVLPRLLLSQATNDNKTTKNHQSPHIYCCIT